MAETLYADIPGRAGGGGVASDSLGTAILQSKYHLCAGTEEAFRADSHGVVEMPQVGLLALSSVSTIGPPNFNHNLSSPSDL